MYNKNDPETIQKMFGSIAKRYDRANFVLSFGLHRYWNHALVKAVGPKKSLLDLCAGTGDIAALYLKKNPHSKVTLIDFSKEMLEIAKVKVPGSEIICGDAQEIPLKDNSRQAITIAYGIRNVKNPLLAYKECYRILEENGVLAILELTRPDQTILKMGHRLYLKTMLPILGKWVASDKNAYHYLSQSVRNFSSPTSIREDLKIAGFKQVEIKKLTSGAVTILLAHK